MQLDSSELPKYLLKLLELSRTCDDEEAIICHISVFDELLVLLSIVHLLTLDYHLAECLSRLILHQAVDECTTTRSTVIYSIRFIQEVDVSFFVEILVELSSAEIHADYQWVFSITGVARPVVIALVSAVPVSVRTLV